MAIAETRARAGNLTAALAAIAFLELLLNRLGNRLFLPHSTVPGESGLSPSGRLLLDSGPFLFHLTGILALLVLLGTLVGLLRRGELFPRSMRFAVAVIALAFWLLGARGVFFGLVPGRFFMLLETSYAILALLIVGSALGNDTQGRVKAGVFLFALPGVLHVLALVSDLRGFGLGPDSAVLATRAGELALLGACLAAPFLLPPRPARERPWRWPLAISTLLTVACITVMIARYDLLQTTLLYGLRVELPRLSSPLGVVYVLAFFAWAYTAVQLLMDKGGMRLTAYGLLLLAMAGYQASAPLELALALLGVLSLSVGELRAAPYGDARRPRIGSQEWRLFLGRLATAAGDGTDPEGTPPEAVVVEEGEMEVSRIRTYRRGLPVVMRLLRRRGTLAQLEVTFGLPPNGGPDGSIERHRSWLARSPEQRVRLPRVKTGDLPFDQKFSVHGLAPLGDAGLRRRLARELGDGMVWLWRGAAARYHLTSGGAPDEAPPVFRGAVDQPEAVMSVVAVLETLADLVEASTPSADPP
jgi:hypothetical protein